LEPFLQLIEKTIRFENICHSKTALRIAVTNWGRGGLKFFSNQDFTVQLGPRVIQASGAIPGFFPPVLIGGEPYVDAAILGYARLHPAIEAGADTLHVIYNDPDVENIPNEELQSILDILYRTFVITWAAQINRSVADVARINGEIDLLKEIMQRSQLSAVEAQRFFQAVLPSGRFRKQTGQEQPEPFRVTVHRYHPRDDPFGSLGFLNLDRDRIASLIERGFNDAVQHDCDASQCVLPKAAMPTAEG
jgi:predicted acylesterase/phospholipase RssA